MSPLLDSGSYSLRPVRNPLIRGTLQQRRKKLLVEPDSHNRARPPPNWRPPRSRTGQPLKVVTSLSFVSPGLDLLVAHAMSVEKVLTHDNIVYETRPQGLPLYRNTQQPVATTEPDNNPALRQLADASELLPVVELRCRAGAICQPTNLQPRLTSGFEAAPSLAETRASPSSQASTTPTPWRSSPARASQR